MSLDPVILFFLLGLIGGLVRAELRLPAAIYDFLSMLLLLTIGLKGGIELAAWCDLRVAGESAVFGCLERRWGVPLIDGGTYACTQGPRLETAAEIERIARDGGDMVGMTGMPEAVLAREAGVAYATLGVVVNHAAGRGSSKEAILLEELDRVLNVSVARAVRILVAFVSGACA